MMKCIILEFLKKMMMELITIFWDVWFDFRASLFKLVS